MTSTFTDRVQGVVSSVAIKAPVRVATTAAITLSGAQTIDGVAVVADDRVLVKDQADQTTNGIYKASNSTWERTPDFDGAYDAVQGTIVYVTSGTVNSGVIFKLTTANTVDFGTDNITFSNAGLGTSAFLTSIGALGTAADKYIYTTAAATAAEGDITSLARNLLDDATTSTMQSTLGGSTIGKTIFTAADAAAVRTAIGASSSYLNDFRLTLTSGTPVTTSDVTAASTIYLTPYKGNSIALYSSSVWTVFNSAQVSVALGTITSARPYDVFAYDSSGTVTLEILAWTNDTTRATALTTQDGVLVKTGDASRRYLGTFYTTSTTTTEDSLQNRYLWNYYNRVNRALKRQESTDTWTYTTATIRQANNSTSNQVNFVVGVSEDCLEASLGTVVRNTNLGVVVVSGFGLDSTTTIHADCVNACGVTYVANSIIPLSAWINTIPSAGRHYLAWLEYSAATGTTTWAGDGGSPTLIFSGITGSIFA